MKDEGISPFLKSGDELHKIELSVPRELKRELKRANSKEHK